MFRKGAAKFIIPPGRDSFEKTPELLALLTLVKGKGEFAISLSAQLMNSDMKEKETRSPERTRLHCKTG